MRIVRNYHGGFRHPLRAFVLGMALIALTLVGFALAAGITTQNSAGRIVVKRIDGTTRVVTHAQPVLTTVVSGSVQRITLPGSDGQVVVVRIRGKRTVRIVRLPPPLTQSQSSTPAASTTVPLAAAAPAPGGVETVTETVYDPITITEPGSTVTETVTESQSTSSSTTDTTATSSP